jgi:hypothetical protein
MKPLLIIAAAALLVGIVLLFFSRKTRVITPPTVDGLSSQTQNFIDQFEKSSDKIEYYANNTGAVIAQNDYKLDGLLARVAALENSAFN